MPAPAQPAQPAQPKEPAAVQSAGLIPLPSPRQVVAAMPLGRRDPFGAIVPQLGVASSATAAAGAGGGGSASGTAVAAAGAAAGSAARGSSAAGATPGTVPASSPVRLGLPDGFRITGVLQSGGRTQAVVEYGGQSGNLRPGDRGGRSTDLLPKGWSVASIDVRRAHVTLENRGQRVTVQL